LRNSEPVAATPGLRGLRAIVERYGPCSTQATPPSP
jgi:hypothetical protein